MTIGNPSSAPAKSFSAWPHRLAVAICCVAFPLVWVGGLVTTYDAGMAVPDWPTTYGYNLFVYPWQTWVFGPFDLLIEHGHRLLGSVVGLLSIAFVFAEFRCDRRHGMRWAAIVMLLLVSSQGVLGGMRVRFDQRELAMLHACLGLGTFAYAAAMSVLTSRYWGELSLPDSVSPTSARRLARLALITSMLVYVQVILGAVLRHVPVGATAGFFRIAVLFHIAMGMAVLVHAVMLAIRTIRSGFGRVIRIELPVGALGLLVTGQFALGVGTWVLKYGWPSWIADQPFAAGFTVQANSLAQATVTTLHMAVGALILAFSVVLTIRAWRIASVCEGNGKSVGSGDAQYSVPSTKYSVLSTGYKVASRQYSVPSTPYMVVPLLDVFLCFVFGAVASYSSSSNAPEESTTRTRTTTSSKRMNSNPYFVPRTPYLVPPTH